MLAIRFNLKEVTLVILLIFFLVQMVFLWGYLIFWAVKEESWKPVPLIAIQGAVVTFTILAIWFNAGNGTWIDLSIICVGIVIPGMIFLKRKVESEEKITQDIHVEKHHLNIIEISQTSEEIKWNYGVLPILKNVYSGESIAIDEIEPKIGSLIKKADELGISGNYNEAVGIYDAVALVFPSSADILFNKANLCYESRHYGEARESYLKVLEIINKTMKEAEKSTKGKDLPNVVSKHEVYYNLGNSEFKLGKLDTAMEYYLKALEEQPNLENAIENIAVILAIKTKTDDAITYYSNAIIDKPDSYRKHYILGKLHFMLNRIDMSIQELKEAVRMNEEFIEGYNLLVEALNSEERFAESVDIYKKILRRQPDSVEVLFGLGKALYNVGLFKEALRTFKAVVELDRKSVEGYYNIGLTYEKNGDVDDAIVAYRKVIEIKGDFISAYTRLWDILSIGDRYQEIINICRKGLECNGNEYILHYYIGVASLRVEKYPEALDAFKSVLELNSEMHSVYLYLGITLMKLEKYEEAIHTFRNALAINPDDNEVIYQISVAYNHLNRYDSVIYNLKKAVQLNPDLKEELQNDKVFESIREMPEFKSMIM